MKNNEEPRSKLAGNIKVKARKGVLMQFKILIIVFTVITSTLSASLIYAKSPTVAIFDFDIGITESASIRITTEKGSSSVNFEASRQTSLLTNKLITKLTNSRAVVVVEREKMATIMGEVQMGQSEMTNPENAIRIGQLLGADYMIFGSITMLDPRVSFKQLPYNAGRQKIISMVVGASMRLVNTETGEIEAAADLQAEKSTKLINPNDSSATISQKFQDEVYTDLANKLATNIVNTLNPIKVATFSGDTVYLARANLAKGSRYEVVKLGEEIRDPDTGELLGQTEEQIAIIHVTAGLKNMSKAKVDEWISSEKAIPKGSICRPLE